MFGWEFPPHIAGGLGTACEGIVKGLAHNGVQTLFVMPHASGDEDQSATTIINASDEPVTHVSKMASDLSEMVKFEYVDSNIVPYVDPEEYFEAIEKMKKEHLENTVIGFGQKFTFSGKYGTNLLEEVSRYALVGGSIAVRHKDEFDIIHAHDWLTYLAGIAAKELTGKPLVVHVHATSYDRGTDDMVDTRVLDIETRGMQAADRVITVSDLTRNIVVN
ncbi:MAG: glycogen/starch synthase, partial [Bacteroidales bacterium]|nr:glycogen/starch synthase [Bacteroidales bacterium]